ncbi:MAG: AfsR/SARP family transcriptional regulator [Jatrophihabitans sp.]
MALGPLRLSTACGLVSPASRISRRILAVLTLSENNEASADSLGTAIWGSTWPRSRSALQVAIHRCRGLLTEQGGGTGIDTTATGYRLELGERSTDVRVFADLAARLPAELSDLGAALGLWRGQVLADEPEVAARFAARITLLERQRRDAALAFGRGSIAEDRPRCALKALEPLAHADPLDEELGALHIQALAATGRQTDAVLAYRRISAALSDELGLYPGPQLRATYEQYVLLTGQDRRRVAAPRRPPGVPSVRRSALHRLIELLVQAADAYTTLDDPARAAAALRQALTAALELGATSAVARIHGQLSDLTDHRDG